MSTIDTLCALVELGESFSGTVSAAGTAPTFTIKRIVRTYESESRAEVDLELLRETSPGTRYRIDKITHIDC